MYFVKLLRIMKTLQSVLSFVLVAVISLAVSGCSVKPVMVDTTTPKIISVSPALGATEVSRDSKVSVVFDKVMDNVALSVVESGGSEIAGNAMTYLTEDKKTCTWALMDNAQLRPDSEYSATVSTESKDMNGNKLESGYSWKFSTVSINVADKATAAEVDTSSQPVSRTNSFSSPATVYAWYSVENARSGTNYRINWYKDGVLASEGEQKEIKSDGALKVYAGVSGVSAGSWYAELLLKENISSKLYFTVM